MAPSDCSESRQFNPDVITLDIEMPDMNGLEMLRRIRREYPQLRVIMFSTLTERGAAVTLEALTLGADDYVAKVSNEGSLDRSMARLWDEMIPKIKQFFRVAGQSPCCLADASGGGRASRGRPVHRAEPAIQTQSGGDWQFPPGVRPRWPQCCRRFLSNFPLPILLVQHMPPLFTRLLAERLNVACQLSVEEASEGDMVEAGRF